MENSEYMRHPFKGAFFCAMILSCLTIIEKNIVKIVYFGRLSYFCFVNEEKEMMRCECEMRIK